MTEWSWEAPISTEDVRAIHKACIDQFGGDPTPDSKEGCIEGSLGSAGLAEFYQSEDSTLPGLCFAGCVLFYLVKNHCFVDGNKRVAWSACMEVLRSLGLTVNASDDEAEQFCTDVILGTSIVKNAIDVSSWLAPRLTALDQNG